MDENSGDLTDSMKIGGKITVISTNFGINIIEVGLTDKTVEITSKHPLTSGTSKPGLWGIHNVGYSMRIGMVLA